MVGCIIFLVLGMITLFFYLKEKIKNYSVKAAAIKSLASVFFIAVAVSGWYSSLSPNNISILGAFVILGLLFGLLGDIWLDLKYVFPQEDKIFTYLGFIVFGIGHIIYITGMNIEFYIPGNVLYLIIPVLVAIISVVGVLILEKPMNVNYGNFKAIVIAYSFILFLMTATSGSLALMHSFKNMTLNLIFIGGIFFVASDLVLSGIYFGKDNEKPANIIINISLYYTAQFLIALSLLFLGV
jgi:hypothetical protein